MGTIFINLEMTRLHYCSKKLSPIEGRFSKCVKKGVLNLFLSISMAYNVISYRKVAENTQILKIAEFAL